MKDLVCSSILFLILFLWNEKKKCLFFFFNYKDNLYCCSYFFFSFPNNHHKSWCWLEGPPGFILSCRSLTLITLHCFNTLWRVWAVLLFIFKNLRSILLFAIRSKGSRAVPGIELVLFISLFSFFKSLVLMVLPQKMAAKQTALLCGKTYCITSFCLVCALWHFLLLLNY